MLSKFVASFALRQRAPMMVSVAQRGFLDRLGLEGQQSTEVALDGKTGEVSLWQDRAKA